MPTVLTPRLDAVVSINTQPMFTIFGPYIDHGVYEIHYKTGKKH
jgi:hypothetical protein